MKFSDWFLGSKYIILEKILKEFSEVKSCPDIVYLGDSTVFRVSEFDEDQRSTADILAADLSAEIRVLGLAKNAYHMGVFYHILNVFKKTMKRPRLIIIPINMRSFSPQWYLRPRWQFREEIDLLDNYCSGSRPKIRLRKKKKDNSAYESNPVEFPISSLKTIGAFEELRLNKSNSEQEERIRKKELFIYFYLYPIVKEHPRLVQLMKTVQLASFLDIKTVFYITPINIEAALKYTGDEFNHFFGKNLEIVKNSLEKTGVLFMGNEVEKNDFSGNEPAVCQDFSNVLGREYFFHIKSIDEHLNQHGRNYISKALQKSIVNFL
jgi:hypothetical protein